MDSRREFLKKAALLAAGGALVPTSIQRAMAIDPPAGTTFLDAEHVVILMQENRSFDHCYGRLRGVRGFNDPRSLTLPNGNPVWLQSNAKGDTYSPFHLNIKETKITWMGSLPHSWTDQTFARNSGHHNGWLDAKASGHKECADMPLTLGFYDRDDIPFYYALADAFTVCDQNFCSSLTGTTPNRLHLWTGTIREKPSIHAKANVSNSDVDYGSEARWMTFPERLEDLGITWRVYQNELSLPPGLSGEAEAWLANFTDNPLEWFTQYQVRFSSSYRRFLAQKENDLAASLAKLEAQPKSPVSSAAISKQKLDLENTRKELATWSNAFAKASARTRSIHSKAFTINEADPYYRELTTLRYKDREKERVMQVPKGDVLHEFREDVNSGKLPAVSWIVAPERFSDHPGAPWFGAWYLSETLDILTQRPDVWKKTIFILCYDENDGYFDHVPPFVPPNPDDPSSGKVSAGIDSGAEYVRTETAGSHGLSGPIGLGFRVPLVIASPWSRGGYVCSQVFDHTSILQFLEKFLSHKTGKQVRESNISSWRRTVCGDLTSVFRPYAGEKIPVPDPVVREKFMAAIDQAKFKLLPDPAKKLAAPDIELARGDRKNCSWLPRQEGGTRHSCSLPYELTVNGNVAPNKKSFVIEFAAGNELFGERAVGAPFQVYASGKTKAQGGTGLEPGRNRAYAVKVGDTISDEWSFDEFDGGRGQLVVYGPNGFFREFRSSASDPMVETKLHQQRNGRLALYSAELRLVNHETQRSIIVDIEDVSYGAPKRQLTLAPKGQTGGIMAVSFDFSANHGWHDLRVRVQDAPHFERRFAGRLESGVESVSDPAMA